jgi:hypothetical protein
VTIKELIEELQRYPQDLIVITAADEEGNDFATAYEITHGYFDTRYQEFRDRALDEESDDDLTERALTLDEANAVCIWP